jgi:hypothetical protein
MRPKANASTGQVIEPVENESIDNALDKGNMPSSTIQRNVVATPCRAVLLTSIHLATKINNCVAENTP